MNFPGFLHAPLAQLLEWQLCLALALSSPGLLPALQALTTQTRAPRAPPVPSSLFSQFPHFHTLTSGLRTEETEAGAEGGGHRADRDRSGAVHTSSPTSPPSHPEAQRELALPVRSLPILLGEPGRAKGSVCPALPDAAPPRPSSLRWYSRGPVYLSGAVGGGPQVHGTTGASRMR